MSLHKLSSEQACRFAPKKGKSARREGRPREASCDRDPAAAAYQEAIDAIHDVREEQQRSVERGPDHDQLARLVRIERLALELANAWREYLEGRQQ